MSYSTQFFLVHFGGFDDRGTHPVWFIVDSLLRTIGPGC
jgi:hypothetical protein